MDVTVISSLQPLTIQGAASSAGHALSVGEHRKMSAHAPACPAVGVSFIPLAFEALGGMSEATTTSLSKNWLPPWPAFRGLTCGLNSSPLPALLCLSLAWECRSLAPSIPYWRPPLLTALFVAFFVLFCFVFSSVLYCVLCSFFSSTVFFSLSICVSVINQLTIIKKIKKKYIELTKVCTCAYIRRVQGSILAGRLSHR